MEVKLVVISILQHFNTYLPKSITTEMTNIHVARKTTGVTK